MSSANSMPTIGGATFVAVSTRPATRLMGCPGLQPADGMLEMRVDIILGGNSHSISGIGSSEKAAFCMLVVATNNFISDDPSLNQLPEVGRVLQAVRDKDVSGPMSHIDTTGKATVADLRHENPRPAPSPALPGRRAA